MGLLSLRALAVEALCVGAMVVVGLLVNRAANRIAAHRTADGEWDENGPKHPTKPKPWEHVSSSGYIGLHLDDGPPAQDQDALPADENRDKPTA